MSLDQGNEAGSARDGVEVRDKLVGYLAEMLCNVPGNGTFLLLPRVPVLPAWAGWDEEGEADRRDGQPRFRLQYAFSSFEHGDWDAAQVQDALGSLWVKWGWDVAATKNAPPDIYELKATAEDSYRFTLLLFPTRESSRITVTSPYFTERSGEAITTPFAVTPSGPLSLAQVCALKPDLIDS